MAIQPIILAGGTGSRLWPLSRELYPKQVISLTGELSLLQTTVQRVVQLEHALTPIIVVGEEHRFLAKSQMEALGLYPDFRIYSITGLTIAYLYFQLPLMILLIIPSLLGLKNEWWEAAINLGASNFQFWWSIGLPILTPSLVSGFLLLFANSFGAYATAWTLTGPDVNLITVQIAALVRGEVQLQPELADALAVISLLIMSLCVLGYILMSNWAKRGHR